MVIENLSDIDDGKYGLILADPPWQQTRGTSKKKTRPNSSGKPLDYPVLSLQEIEEHLRLASQKAGDNSILFLWTIEKYLLQAEAMAKGLGYKLHARMVWDKVTGIPAAFTVRFAHEYLLYMWKGKFTRVADKERGKISTVFREQPKYHSHKPTVAYEIIERLYPGLNKLEMYARNERDGWDCWGNEVGTDNSTTKINNNTT